MLPWTQACVVWVEIVSSPCHPCLNMSVHLHRLAHILHLWHSLPFLDLHQDQPQSMFPISKPWSPTPRNQDCSPSGQKHNLSQQGEETRNWKISTRQKSMLGGWTPRMFSGHRIEKNVYPDLQMDQSSWPEEITCSEHPPWFKITLHEGEERYVFLWAEIGRSPTLD